MALQREQTSLLVDLGGELRFSLHAPQARRGVPGRRRPGASSRLLGDGLQGIDQPPGACPVRSAAGSPLSSASRNLSWTNVNASDPEALDHIGALGRLEEMTCVNERHLSTRAASAADIRTPITAACAKRARSAGSSTSSLLKTSTETSSESWSAPTPASSMTQPASVHRSAPGCR